MSLTNPKKVVTEQRLNEFYNQIYPYLGGVPEAGFTPIGTVIALMGNTAPVNYLACNGQTVNIVDYVELADYFKQQFGSVDYFGGDGTTTFGIPDLRGEFLRGSGIRTNGKGSGANVGIHQDGTELPYEGLTIGSSLTKSRWKRFDDSWKTVDGNYTNGYKNMDYHYGNDNKKVFNLSSSATVADTTNEYVSIGIRPTNTSVLYCIATKNIYLNPSLDYSTNEKVVGHWIDGKPLYQKTFDFGAVSAGTTKGISLLSYSIEQITNFSAVGNINSGLTSPIPFAHTSTVTRQSFCRYDDDGQLHIYCGGDGGGFTQAYVTIQYTKTTD